MVRLKIIKQYATPIMSNPTVAQRASLKKATHIWKYGDRLYNLSYQYYGDSSYWWAIAWYNGYPTEAHIYTGATIFIPLVLESLLSALNI